MWWPARFLRPQAFSIGRFSATDAVSIVHQLDYLLTWNQKHLANPNKRIHLTIITARARLRLPELATPDLMRLE